MSENVGDTFWIVLRTENDGRNFTVPGNPYRHTSFDSAKVEAFRLAREHPGKRFFVFASLGFATTHEPVTWTKHDEIPF